MERAHCAGVKTNVRRRDSRNNLSGEIPTDIIDRRAHNNFWKRRKKSGPTNTRRSDGTAYLLALTRTSRKPMNIIRRMNNRDGLSVRPIAPPPSTAATGDRRRRSSTPAVVGERRPTDGGHVRRAQGDDEDESSTRRNRGLASL
uniref:Uncharacterized protein n=1 Tax=Plectus sambesii TaxID=2011161 RepID=A0A914W3Q1_9BILA